MALVSKNPLCLEVLRSKNARQPLRELFDRNAFLGFVFSTQRSSED